MTFTRLIPLLLTLVLLPTLARAADGGKVTAPLNLWEEMLATLEQAKKTEPPAIPVCPVARTIKGVFRKGLFDATLSYSFEVLDPGGHVRIPVLDGAASLGSVRLNGKATSLAKQGDLYTLGVDQPGAYKVDLEFFWGREQDRFARTLRFRLPEGGATQVSVLIPEQDIVAELAHGALLSQAKAQGGTQVEGFLDPSGWLDLSWKRKLTHRGREKIRLEPRLNILYTLHEITVSAVAVLDAQILEGETDRIDLKVPAGVEVTKVEGRAVLQPLQTPDGSLAVLLRYLVGEEQHVRIAVHFQFPIEPGKPFELFMPTLLGDLPLPGAVGVQGPAGIEVKVQESAGAEAQALRDLPAELTELTASPLLLGFTFQAPPRIKLLSTAHRKVELTSTLIDEVQASSVVIEDGTEITKLKVRIRNNTSQYLTLRLPARAILTHSLIDGRPIRPAITKENEREALLFPLRQSERPQAGAQTVHVVHEGETLSDIANYYYSDPNRWREIVQANPDQLAQETDVAVDQQLKIPSQGGLSFEEGSFVIELAYRLVHPALGSLGRFTLALPEVDVDTMKVIWHLYLPEAVEPLSFQANLVQYSAIRYDPFRRLRDFLLRVFSFEHNAWASGKYQNILSQRKVIYLNESEQKSRGEVVLSSFPLTGARYRFKRSLMERETPQIQFCFVSQRVGAWTRFGALAIAFGLMLLLITRARRWPAYLVAGLTLAALLVLAHYVLGVHRRILWGVDLALLLLLLRLRAGPCFRSLKALVLEPWIIVRVLTLRNLLFLAGLCALLWLILWFPLLLSSLSAVALFLWWRREARRAQKEVAHG